MTLHQVVHIEIPAEDLARAQKFYSEMFGWQFSKTPTSGEMEYWMADVKDEKGQSMHGVGLMKRMVPGQQITDAVSVASVDESSAKVEALGGKILKAKMAVPGMGWYAMCQDTEGNVFTLWQVDMTAK